jgi:hypothetical protein
VTETSVPRLATVRWTRHGHDRLYVNGPDDETLGYRDLLDGTDHAATELHRAVVGTLADSWVRETGWTSPAVPTPVPTPAPAEPGWTDLSRNVPGAAVRAKAADLAPGDASSWLLGADGEERVGQVLGEVTRAHPAWQAMHALPVGHRGSDIDHVVMGPGGVFTLNTKNHAGSRVYVNRDGYLVNGSRTPYVRNARHEAERAARLLSAATGIRLHVTGLVVPVGARELNVRVPPEGVFVVPADQLHRWLRGTGEILPVDVLARVWEAARRSTTWEC